MSARRNRPQPHQQLKRVAGAWRQAFAEEHQAIVSNRTILLALSPTGHLAVACNDDEAAELIQQQAAQLAPLLSGLAGTPGLVTQIKVFRARTELEQLLVSLIAEAFDRIDEAQA